MYVYTYIYVYTVNIKISISSLMLLVKPDNNNNKEIVYFYESYNLTVSWLTSAPVSTLWCEDEGQIITKANGMTEETWTN